MQIKRADFPGAPVQTVPENDNQAVCENMVEGEVIVVVLSDSIRQEDGTFFFNSIRASYPSNGRAGSVDFFGLFEPLRNRNADQKAITYILFGSDESDIIKEDRDLIFNTLAEYSFRHPDSRRVRYNTRNGFIINKKGEINLGD